MERAEPPADGRIDANGGINKRRKAFEPDPVMLVQPPPEEWLPQGPSGRFYCGSMAYDKQPGAAARYRLDPDLSVRPVVNGVTFSNGLDWSPDGFIAYFNADVSDGAACRGVA